MIDTNEIVKAVNDAWLKENAADIQEINHTSTEVKIGKLVAANVVKVVPKDTTKPQFDKIVLVVKELGGKVHTKDFNVDFMRKYCAQNRIKLSQAENFPVVFKIGQYKKIGFFAFVATDMETGLPVAYTDYEEIPESDNEKLEKLGL